MGTGKKAGCILLKSSWGEKSHLVGAGRPSRGGGKEINGGDGIGVVHVGKKNECLLLDA